MFHEPRRLKQDKRFGLVVRRAKHQSPDQYYVLRAVAKNVAKFNPQAEVYFKDWYTHAYVCVEFSEPIIVPEWWASEDVIILERFKGSDGRAYAKIERA
jgi:hypothetical protein